MYKFIFSMAVFFFRQDIIHSSHSNIESLRQLTTKNMIGGIGPRYSLRTSPHRITLCYVDSLRHTEILWVPMARQPCPPGVLWVRSGYSTLLWRGNLAHLVFCGVVLIFIGKIKDLSKLMIDYSKRLSRLGEFRVRLKKGVVKDVSL